MIQNEPKPKNPLFKPSSQPISGPSIQKNTNLVLTLSPVNELNSEKQNSSNFLSQTQNLLPAQGELESKNTFISKRCSASINSQKLNYSEFAKKQYELSKVIKENHENAIKIAITNEMKNCTFDPEIKEKREPRSFEKFLHEQRKHSEKRDQIISEMRTIKEIEEQKNFKKIPQISEVCFC